jgi:hypothetical protein
MIDNPNQVLADEIIDLLMTYLNPTVIDKYILQTII